MPKIVTIVALSIAVASAVAAFFSSHVIAAIGFILLGISSAYLGYKANSSVALVKKMTTKMDEDAKNMEIATVKTRELTLQLANQADHFENNRIQIQNEVERFQQENAQLQQAQRNWEVEKQQLNQSQIALTQIKQGLQREIQQLKASQENLKMQIKQFLIENLEMGKKIKNFQRLEGNFSKNEEKLEHAIADLDKRFDGNAAQLANNIQLGKDTIQEIIQFMNERKIKQDMELEDLRKIVAQLRTAEEKWKKQATEIETKQKKIEEDRQAIEQLKKQLDETERKLSETQAKAAEELKNIKRENEKLVQETASLTQLKKQLEQAEPSVASLDQLLKRKKKLLKMIDEQVLKKIDNIQNQIIEKRQSREAKNQAPVST